MEPVGELDEDHAQVAHHRQQHLAERLRLLLFLRHVGVARDLRDAVHQLGHVVAKKLLQRLLRRQSVFEHVVKQTDGDRGLVEPHLREDVGDVEGMDEVRLAGAAHLAAMLACREDEGLVEQLLIEVGLVAFDFVEDVFEADHGGW